MYKFFTDTETTGLSDEHDQIVSFSSIIEDSNGELIDSSEHFILLKPNINPDPSAMIITNINTFSSEFKAKAHKESYITDYLKKNAEYKEILVIAYNGQFDDKMYAASLKRNGIDYYQLFPKRFDPLKTVKVFTNSNLLLTPLVHKGFKSYRSAKLEDVYTTLGYDSSVFNAHTALDDTKMLRSVAYGIFFLATGRDLATIKTDLPNLKKGDIFQFVVDYDELGLKTKTFYILQNDVLKQKIQVIDTSGNSEILSYHVIYDQFDAEEKEKKFFTKDYDTFLIKIPHSEPIKTNIYNVEFLEKLHQEFNELTLEEKKVKSTLLEPTIFMQLKDYAYSKYYDFWDVEVFGIEYDVLPEILSLEQTKSKVNIVMEKNGKYKLIVNDNLIYETEKKTELEKKIKEIFKNELVFDENMITNDPKYQIQKGLINSSLNEIKKNKSISIFESSNETFEENLRDFFNKNLFDNIVKKELKKIKSTKDFIIKKHPLNIREDFEKLKGEIFSGTNKNQKDILKDCLFFYQKKYPTYFKDISLPTFQLNLSSFMKK